MPTVTSVDGTTIAYDRTGTGPALILINGALGDRRLDRRFKLMSGLAAQLNSRFTVIDYDRRGRGESSEAGPFAVDREIEDIAALIAAAGGRASLFGFSSGAALALRAAGSGIGVERVAAYEPPFVVTPEDRGPRAGYGRRLEELIAADDRSGAVKHFMRNAMGMPAPAVVAMKLMPAWKDMEANAPTLRYDWAALGEHNMNGTPLRPDEWASVTTPALIVCGGKSTSTLKRAARELVTVLPNAQLRVLDGMGHRLKVDRLAPVLSEFFVSGEPNGKAAAGGPAIAERVGG
jgi:pimeloyl-ACP methyl ester carboxylesterase